MEKVVLKPEHMTSSKKLQALRDKVAMLNRQAGKGVDFRYAVQYYPRVGKFNPNQWKYDNKFRRKWRLEDADEVVAYVAQVPRRGK